VSFLRDLYSRNLVLAESSFASLGNQPRSGDRVKPKARLCEPWVTRA